MSASPRRTRSGTTLTPLFFDVPCGIAVVVTGPPARAEEVDGALQGSEGGVDAALLYAKAWSKYSKELLAWAERRIAAGE